MKKLFKCFIIFISFISIIFALNKTAFSMDAADVNTLRDRILSSVTLEADEGWDKVGVYKGPVFSRLRAEHNTALHDEFKWKWELYVVVTWNDPGDGIKVVLREYQEYSTRGGRGFVEYVIADRNMDGIADKWMRDYNITNSCDGKDFYFVRPEYPEGYINSDWYKISQEEANKIYEKVITYFLEHYKGRVI